MATAKATTKSKDYFKNDRVAKDLAGDFPRYMVVEGDKIIELSHSERAMLKFSRALPEDLLADFNACLQLKGGEAFHTALEAFKMKLEPRRDELVGW